MSPPTVAPGDRFGPYDVVASLGEGGMGQVWRAVGPDGTEVALKTLADAASAGEAAPADGPGMSGDETLAARFAREVAAARSVEHPHVAAVVDADTDHDPPWVATELVAGPTLADRVAADGSLPAEETVALAIQLADGLAAIHAADVVHRDLNPSNVVLGPAGAVIVDFGVAWVAGATDLTRTGTVVGTPAWLAPEQLGEDEPTDASDVWAWGLVVAYAATGRRPVTGSRPEVVMRRVMDAEVEVDLGALPSGLRGPVQRALEARPARRPTAEELVSDLRGPSFPEPTAPVSADETTATAVPSAPDATRQFEVGGAAPTPEAEVGGAPPSDRAVRWAVRLAIIAALIGVGFVVPLLLAVIIGVVGTVVAIGLRVWTEERSASGTPLVSAGTLFVGSLGHVAAALSDPLGPVAAVLVIVGVVAAFVMLGGDF